MHTMNTVSTRSVPMVQSRMAVPPPLRQDLRDNDDVVGWIDGMAVGFRGFGDEVEAMHAAWVGYRTMARRFARVRGRRPIPVDSEPLSLGRSGEVELILAGGRPIGTLVRPGYASPSGPESFGFELQLPVPAGELTMRSTADLMYRAIRRSGIRWTMWMSPPAAAPVSEVESARATVPQPVSDSSAGVAGGSGAARSSWLATTLIILAVLALVGLPAITADALVPLLGGGAALVALLAVVGLTVLVVTDSRDVWREGARAVRRDPVS